jgi:hypothetical protein
MDKDSKDKALERYNAQLDALVAAKPVEGKPKARDRMHAHFLVQAGVLRLQ